MPLSRTQISRQLVFLLQQSGIFGVAASVFEGSLLAENFLASGLAFPIAVVLTGGSEQDSKSCLNRIETAQFTVSVAAGKVTEPLKANYLASGGSSSSQRALENVVTNLFGNLSVSSRVFVGWNHGFQGTVVSTSRERLVPAQGTTFDVCDINIEVYDVSPSDYYMACGNFKAVADGGHSIALTWVNPGPNFGDYQNILRRGTNPGDAAPTTVLGGTGIVISGGVQGTSANDTGPSGAGQTYNYALFRTYNAGANVSASRTASATSN